MAGGRQIPASRQIYQALGEPKIAGPVTVNSPTVLAPRPV